MVRLAGIAELSIGQGLIFYMFSPELNSCQVMLICIITDYLTLVGLSVFYET